MPGLKKQNAQPDRPANETTAREWISCYIKLRFNLSGPAFDMAIEESNEGCLLHVDKNSVFAIQEEGRDCWHLSLRKNNKERIYPVVEKNDKKGMQDVLNVLRKNVALNQLFDLAHAFGVLSGEAINDSLPLKVCPGKNDSWIGLVLREQPKRQKGNLLCMSRWNYGKDDSCIVWMFSESGKASQAPKRPAKLRSAKWEGPSVETLQAIKELEWDVSYENTILQCLKGTKKRDARQSAVPYFSLPPLSLDSPLTMVSSINMEQVSESSTILDIIKANDHLNDFERIKKFGIKDLRGKEMGFRFAMEYVAKVFDRFGPVAILPDDRFSYLSLADAKERPAGGPNSMDELNYDDMPEDACAMDFIFQAMRHNGHCGWDIMKSACELRKNSKEILNTKTWGQVMFQSKEALANFDGIEPKEIPEYAMLTLTLALDETMQIGTPALEHICGPLVRQMTLIPQVEAASEDAEVEKTILKGQKKKAAKPVLPSMSAIADFAKMFEYAASVSTEYNGRGALVWGARHISAHMSNDLLQEMGRCYKHYPTLEKKAPSLFAILQHENHQRNAGRVWGEFRTKVEASRDKILASQSVKSRTSRAEIPDAQPSPKGEQPGQFTESPETGNAKTSTRSVRVPAMPPEPALKPNSITRSSSPRI